MDDDGLNCKDYALNPIYLKSPIKTIDVIKLSYFSDSMHSNPSSERINSFCESATYLAKQALPINQLSLIGVINLKE